MTPTQLILAVAFTMSLLGTTLNRTHLVSALLCIESMLVSLYLAIIVLTQNIQLTTTSLLPMSLLAYSACEASAGLALLVASNRTHATDHLKTLNLLQC
nr:NADH dehydrogenase subunit 4L [Goniurosaurus splendens]